MISNDKIDYKYKPKIIEYLKFNTIKTFKK